MADHIVVVDNHDSFVHTLVDYLVELGAAVDLVEADEIEPSAAAAALGGYDGVLISPGPGNPAHAGGSIAVVHAAANARIPLLGVCLGHQAIAEAFGATVGHAPELMHGMTSEVGHATSGLFEGMPQPFTAGRYHSLAVDAGTLPDDLMVTAWTDAGIVMGIATGRGSTVFITTVGAASSTSVRRSRRQSATLCGRSSACSARAASMPVRRVRESPSGERRASGTQSSCSRRSTALGGGAPVMAW